MSVEDNLGNVSVKKITRTFQFRGIVPRGQAPGVEIGRETLLVSSTGELLAPPQVRHVSREWSQIKSKSWTLKSGAVITAEEIFEALSLAFDELVADYDAEQAAAPPE